MSPAERRGLAMNIMCQFGKYDRKILQAAERAVSELTDAEAKAAAHGGESRYQLFCRTEELVGKRNRKAQP